MTKKSELIKKLVKTNVGEKPTFGTDPRDPWSAKAGITEESLNETALLNRYLKSRGINPEFVNKDQKVAHSKTNQFKTWMAAHINDPVQEGMSQEHTPTEKRLHTLKRAMHFQKEIRVAGSTKKLHSEAVDKKDTITFDIPLLIRVLEFAREELKSDILLHKMVERLIAIRGKGTLTMNQYGRIVKEEAESLGESYGPRADKLLAHSHALYKQSRTEADPVKKQQLATTSSRAHKIFIKARNKNIAKDPEAHARKMQSGATQDYKDQEAKRGIGNVRDHVEVEGQSLDETWKYHTYPDNTVARAAVKAHHEFRDEKGMASGNPARAMGNGKVAYKGEFKGPKPQKRVAEGKEGNYGGDYQSSVLRMKEKAAKKPVDIKSLADRMQASYRKDNQTKGVKKVGESLEPMAACNCPSDGANTPDDVAPKDKGKKLIQMSKTAKLIKSVVKGKNIKEEMYDHEKEDKSTAPLGKKVKLQKPDQDAITKEQPKAAAILTGGKTLTGEPRDTIEIDPMMKMRKQSGNSQKSV